MTGFSAPFSKKQYSGAPSWSEMFARLKAFRRKHGHANVPHDWPQDPVLSYWVYFQRCLFIPWQMDPNRKQLLDELKFDWTLPDDPSPTPVPFLFD
jgi:hypothetical protein